MLKAVGFSDADLKKPLIGVANTWIEIGPCNYHLRTLAADVKEGIRAAGATPMEFNTVSISDGITMGTEGMRASLVSREVIADSIELVARGNGFDGLVILVGCDKTIPGADGAGPPECPGRGALRRIDRARRVQGKPVTIQDVFEAVGAHASGIMSDADFRTLEDVACPGAGACGGQFTANTMAIVCEALGIAALGSGSVPATDPAKSAVGRTAGEQAVKLAAAGLKPRNIITPRAIRNAIAVVAATGGSTNAVLHLLAIAREAGIELSLADFDRISAKTPLIADLKPSGRFVATELHAAGGTPLVIRRLVESGAIDGSAPTVTGRTLAEEAAKATEAPGQEVVRPNDRPLKPHGGLVILFGNLAPEGAVLKLSGPSARSIGAGACSTAKSRHSKRSSSRRSRRETSSSSATKGRPAAPGCAKCSRSPPRSSAPASAIRWRFDRRLLGRDARLHHRPRVAGSLARRTDCRAANRRHRRARRREPPPRRGAHRRADQGTDGVMDGARAAVSDRRDGEYARMVSSASVGAVTG